MIHTADQGDAKEDKRGEEQAAPVQLQDPAGSAALAEERVDAAAGYSLCDGLFV